MNLKISNAEYYSENKQKYIDFINQSESIQEWLSNAPSQLLEYDVVQGQDDGLLRIRVLLKNAYLFDDLQE